MRYQITIASPPGREELVAEISWDHVQWAEINQEDGDRFEVEFYPRPDRTPWTPPFADVCDALQEGMRRLLQTRG